jgi:DNA polymerase-3 subunit epsilon
LKFLALDFETANRHRDSPCALGVTLMDGGEITHQGYWLIKPFHESFDYWNIKVHGIRPVDVENAPEFDYIWEENLKPLLKDRFLVAHNASFDMYVLRDTLHAYGIEMPWIDYLCSVQLSRKAWPGLATYSLGPLARHFGISIKHHHAGSDAEACAHLAAKAFKEYDIRDTSELHPMLGMRMRGLKGEKIAVTR